jgi:hypothetical protein
MERHDYHFQYRVYSLALRRWLEDAGLDPAAHWGGVYYVFLWGGMSAPPAGTRSLFRVSELPDFAGYERELLQRLEQEPWSPPETDHD